jgi:putative transcriptional regulator
MMEGMEELTGRLLVATPVIESGPFLRSVVFVLDHDADGTLGVIVNRPLPSDVEDVLPGWTGLVNAPGCLFDGGPVGVDSALAIGLVADVAGVAGEEGEVADDSPPPGWRRMTGRVGLVDLEGPVPASRALVGLRVFAGYAGWSPGQLVGELAEGAWLIADALDSDLISPRPEQLWREVLRRQAGDVRFWATFPDDPSTN